MGGQAPRMCCRTTDTAPRRRPERKPADPWRADATAHPVSDGSALSLGPVVDHEAILLPAVEDHFLLAPAEDAHLDPDRPVPIVRKDLVVQLS